MKHRYLKLKSWLLATVVGSLGASSCCAHKQAKADAPEPVKAERERGEIRLMYGVPTMNYRVSGRVVDPAGKPVGGIQVNLLEPGIEATADTVYGDPTKVKQYLQQTGVSTDQQGNFTTAYSGRPNAQLRLLVRDTDGPKNGSFSNQIVNVEITPNDIDGSNAEGWNQGTASKDIEVRLEQR